MAPPPAPPSIDLLSLDDPAPAPGPAASGAAQGTVVSAAWDPFALPAGARGHDPSTGWDVFQSSSSASLPALEAQSGAARRPAPPAAAASVDPFAEIVRPPSSASLAGASDPFALPSAAAPAAPATARSVQQQQQQPTQSAAPPAPPAAPAVGGPTHKPAMSHENILALFDKPKQPAAPGFPGDMAFGGFVSAPAVMGFSPMQMNMVRDRGRPGLA